jgi:acyl-CoA synthetase (AMP-forming)/AMP-acid ligase II
MRDLDAQIRNAMRQLQLLPADWPRLSAQRSRTSPCFVCDRTSESVTFPETSRRVDAIAGSLVEELGLDQGDHLAIFGVDCHRYVELVLACARLGITVIPLNNRLADLELHNLLERGKARALAVTREYQDRGKTALDTVDCVEALIDLDGSELEGTSASVPAWARSGRRAPERDVDPEDIFSISFTSGTTGRAKGVMQSHRMIRNMVNYMNVAYDVDDYDTEFRYSAAPLFHVAGMGMVLMGIARGFPSLICAGFEPKQTLRWMQGGALSAVFLVPTMISMLLELDDVERGDYGQLRTILYGASPMPSSLLKRAQKTFGCDFVQAFGAGTEAGLQTALTAQDHRRAAAGEERLLDSIGKTSFGVDLRLVDEDLNDVPLGEVGEIATRSETVMSGYFEMPEETAEALRGGWFRAGDLAWMDEEGYLYLSGRKKDMIIRGGENIYPVEIETVLGSHPGVRECAVIGVADEHWGERVKACVVLAAEDAPTEEELRAYCRENLAKYKVPELFEFVEDFPRNASGKILKRELRSR